MMLVPERGRQHHETRHAALKTQRSSIDAHWRDLASFIQPRRSRFFQTEAGSAGQKKNQNIINGTAGRAKRILQSGMMASITSPARPWFRMTTQNPDLAKRSGVIAWLQLVQERILGAMSKSNLYNVLHQQYGDLALFGTAPSIIEEDLRRRARAYLVPVGSYCLATSDRGEVDTLYRETTLTVRQVVKKFGLEPVSSRVRDLYARGTYDEPIEVVQVIEPREVYDPEKFDGANMPWASCWYEVGDNNASFLKVSGYQETPILGPRWDILDNDVYGTSPAMNALGDVRSLQIQERRKLQGVELMIDPPLIGPNGLQRTGVSLFPGAVSFTDLPAGGQKLEPIKKIPPEAITVIRESTQEHCERINSEFYADLWLMMSESTDPRKTAREVAERHEEKMLQLGPVMERLEDEMLAPMVERFFGIELRKGDLPPPPPELQGSDLHVEFLSIMAQAQKMISGSAVGDLVGFVTSLQPLKPEAVDKLDADEAIDQMADSLGVNPAVIITGEKVATIRTARAKAAAVQQQQQAALAASQGAKNLAQSDTSKDNALTRLAGGVAAAQVDDGEDQG